jgi:HSP20 family molecular chaperone IbpA
MVTSKTLSLFSTISINSHPMQLALIESSINSIHTLQIMQHQQVSRHTTSVKGVNILIVIDMALAGFSKNDIEIEVTEGLLTVRSIKENDENDSNIYRGISYRKFNRKFTLADDIVVNDASLENGMLEITLERIVPDAKKPRKITIK